jgi:hypothetical protein
MSYAGRSSHSERFPIFDGNDYVYWKEKMRIRLQAINLELWHIVEHGYLIQNPDAPNSDDKAILRLNAQAKDIICDSISIDMFFRFRKLDTAKQLWDAIKNAHEEFITRTDPHTEMLQAMFAGFGILRRESAMELTDRLTNIVERLHRQEITDITDRDVVEKLLSAFDATFDPIITEIEQRPDYEELHYVEVMKLLSIHEEKMELKNGFQETSSESEERYFHTMAVHKPKKILKINTPSHGN